MAIDFDKLEETLKKACKDRVYVSAPMGGSSAYGSYSLNLHEDYRPVEKRRGYIASVSMSKHRSETTHGRTTSWYENIPTARADADLLALLWNNAAELIRLAKLGEQFESFQQNVNTQGASS